MASTATYGSGLLYFTTALLTALVVVDAVRDVSTYKLRMPGVRVEQSETYLCHAAPVDTRNSHFIVGFEPNAHKETAHHMLLYGCKTPGMHDAAVTGDAWACGEMAAGSTAWQQGPVCGSGSQIIYAWALDAPSLQLPKDVGFKIGGDSDIDYLVVQVHYRQPTGNRPDKSGIDIKFTDDILPKQAGVYLLGTSGFIPPRQEEHFETACQVQQDVKLHPFAFRTHTHKLGKVVSGYVIQDGEWKLLGKKDPQLPEMFYEAADTDLVISNKDVLAARCTMYNNLDHTVSIGSTGKDEMCNFYMMYWVDGDRVLDSKQCFTWGPPSWYWQDFRYENGARLPSPPNDVSTLPADEDAEHMMS